MADPTIKQIEDFEIKLHESMQMYDQKMHKIRKLLENLSAIKMVGREEITPAIIEESHEEPIDVNDSSKGTRKVIDIEASSETRKTIFDIMPNTPLLSNEKLTDVKRLKVFNDVKTIFDTV